MSRVQLSLPYSTIRKLSDEEKLKLILHQSQSLQLSELEIEQLIKLCKEKQCVNKGMALVFKFAGYIDEIKNSISDIIFNLAKYFPQFDRAKIFEVPLSSKMNRIEEKNESNELPGEILVCFLKLAYLLCSWRRLQWLPRPIYIECTSNITLTLMEYLLQIMEMVCKTTGSSESDKYFEFRSLLEKLLLKFCSPFIIAAKIDLSSTASLISDVFDLETRISTEWDELADKNLPTFPAHLCLPYPFLKNSTKEQNWFLSESRSYEATVDMLVEVVEQICKSCEENALICIDLDKISVFREHRKLEKYFDNWGETPKSKCLQSNVAHVSYSNISPLTILSKWYPYEDTLHKINPSDESKSASKGTAHLSKIARLNDRDFNEELFGEQVKSKEFLRSEIPAHTSTMEGLEENKSSNYSSGALNLGATNYVRSSIDQNIAPSTDISHLSINGSNTKPLRTKKQSVSEEIDATHSSRIRRSESYEPFVEDSGLHRDYEGGEQEEEIIYYVRYESPTKSQTAEEVLVENDHHIERSRGRLFTTDGISLTSQSKRKSPSDLSYFRRQSREMSDPIGLRHRKEKNSVLLQSRATIPPITRDRLWSSGRKLRGLDFSMASLSVALRQAEEFGGSLENISARKIQIWFMLVGPRKKLMKRLLSRELVLGIIDDIIERTNKEVIVRRKRKILLMRHGAALKIQRLVRFWIANILEKERLLEREERSRRAWGYLTEWVRCVRNSIRIFHFVRYALRRRQRISGVTRAQRLLRIIDKYFLLYSMNKRIVIRHIIATSAASTGTINTHMKNTNERRLVAYKKMERAVLKIQHCFRLHLAHLRHLASVHENLMRTRIYLFFARLFRQRRKKKEFDLNRRAVVIQRFLRGAVVRKRMFRLVKAGLLLNQFWRKQLAYRNLRTQLRRIDRPLTIRLHSLRNINKKMLNSRDIRYRVSVWWNPLLHIVGEDDFQSILSKPPQFMYTSGIFKASPEDYIPVEGPVGSISRGRQSPLISMINGSYIKPSSSSVLLDSTPQRQQSNSHEEVEQPSRATMQGARVNSQQSLDRTIQKLDVLPNINNKFNETQAENNASVLPGSDRSASKNDGVTLGDSSVLPTPKLSKDASTYFAEKIKMKVAQRRASINATSNSTTEAIKKGPSYRDGSLFEDDEFSSSSSDEDAVGVAAPLKAVKQTIKFVTRISSFTKKTQLRKKTKLVCIFEDGCIRVPGCHGNSVIKIDFLEGDRVLGSTVCNLRQEGHLMYWGGEYQREVIIAYQRRGIMINAQLMHHRKASKVSANTSDPPIIDFRVVTGAPLRSRCQWARVVARGNGPLKRAVQNRTLGNYFQVFESWQRFYLSLDEVGLFFFDNKFFGKPFFVIPVRDLKSVTEDSGISVGSGSNKKSVEDLVNVILTTHEGDEILFRFPDAPSRYAWEEVIANSINFYLRIYGSRVPKSWNWLSGRKFASQTSISDDNEQGNSAASHESHLGSPSRKTLHAGSQIKKRLSILQANSPVATRNSLYAGSSHRRTIMHSPTRNYNFSEATNFSPIRESSENLSSVVELQPLHIALSKP